MPHLAHDLPRLSTRLHLIVGERDRAVPPEDARKVKALLGPAARGQLHSLAGLGHLAHEEAPQRMDELLGGMG